MELLLALGLLIAVTVVPIMVGARVVNAKNTGFGSAFLAVILLTALSIAVKKFVDNQALAFLASAAGGGFFLAGILGTTFWRGIAVSVIAVAVQVAVLLMFAGAIFGTASVAG